LNALDMAVVGRSRTLAIRRLYTWLTLVPLATAACLAIIRAIRLVPAPYELGYGEGLVLWQALHATTPSAVYHAISSSPFVVGVYPPLYLLVTRLLDSALGNIQVAGRLTTLMAFLGTLVVVAGLVRSALPSRLDPVARWAGALAAAFLTASVSSVRGFVPSARVDGLGLLLTLLGLLIFVRARGSFRREVLAFGFFVAAMLTKQSFVAAPLACLIVTARGDLRRTLRLAGAGAVLGLLPLGWLTVVTNGQIFLHLFAYTQNHFSVLRMVTLTSENLREMLPLVALAAVVPGAMLLRPAPSAAADASSGEDAVSASRARVVAVCLSVYVLCAFTISLTCGKVGSAPCYFMEWNAACCVLAGSCFGRAVDRRSDPARRASLVAASAVLAGFGLLATAETANQALRLTPGAARIEAARVAETEQVLQLVRSTPGLVYSDDLTILVKAGRDLPVEPFIMFELARDGRWDIAPFVDQIAHGAFSLLVTQADVPTNDLMPRELQDAIAAHYRRSATIGSYRIYSPITR
jgi:hypothetical protein